MANPLVGIAKNLAARAAASANKAPEENSDGTPKVNAGAAAANVLSSLPLIKWGAIILVVVILIVFLGGVVSGVGQTVSNLSVQACTNKGENNKLITEAEGQGYTVPDSAKEAANAEPTNTCKGVGYNGQTYPPTTGNITTHFGVVDELHPNGHGGLDIADYCGAPIFAFAGGEVTSVTLGTEEKSSSGNYVYPAGTVIIKHTEEFSTMYHHIKGSTTTVAVGDIVNAGDQIATQWSNGSSTGCHLHIEAYMNGEKVDMEEILTAAGITYPLAESALPPKPDPTAAPTTGGVPTVPGSAKSIAQTQVAARGWAPNEFSECLVPLWNRESGWSTTAQNNAFAPSKAGIPENQAYGIPQAAPGSKMASTGADWKTNPATQITWGLNYIAGRYGTPCAAWAHSEAYNWY